MANMQPRKSARNRAIALAYGSALVLAVALVAIAELIVRGVL